MFRKAGLVVVSMIISCSAFAQTVSSPISQIGVGQKSTLALPAQFGMAGLGISNGDVRFLNLTNPALLTYNSMYSFSAGVNGSSVTLEDKVNSQRNSSANFNHIAMSFPVKPGKWTMAMSLRPYSAVAYQFKKEVEITNSDGETYTNTFKGEGGVTQFMLSNGVKIVPNLSVGLNAGFLFGSSIQEQSSSSDDFASFYDVGSVKKESLTGFAFGAGAAYTHKLKDKLNLNLGLTYDFKSNTRAEKVQNWETRVGDIPVTADTLGGGLQKGNIQLPSSLGLGVSIVNPLKWSAGIDVRMEDWGNYQAIDGSTDPRLDKRLEVAAGAEITPDAGDIDSYLKRVTYRIGLGYEDTPFVINGSNVQDFGINFGFSLPVSSISSLDMGFKFGTRGEIGKIGHKEDYFKFQVGLTFNDRLWFIKRKFD